MFVRIPKLLSDNDLAFIDEMIASGSFLDGAGTTGAPTKSAKNNTQLDIASHPAREDLLKRINQVMNGNQLLRAAVLPRRMTQPLISRYTKGMSYGWHIDNPLMMGGTAPIRSDIACTVFLNNSADYEGGELVVRTATGDVQIKLERGDAFLYPATSRHQVKEISSGTRLALVLWIQSMIADASQREILYDLELAYDRMKKDSPDSDAISYLQRAQANLVRRWSEV